MIQKYRVLFKGLSEDKTVFQSRMSSMGAPQKAVDMMVKKAPVILKEGLTQERALRYAEAVHEAGGKVAIQRYERLDEPSDMNESISIASFRDFTVCSECGLKQLKGESCSKCGGRLGESEKT